MRLRREKKFLLVLCLTAALLLGGCSSGSGVEKNQFEVGDKVSTFWFDFTVDQVETADFFGSYTAREGCRLAVCRLTIKNTFDQDVPMGWADFILQWESAGEDADASAAGGVEGAYTLPQYTQDQFLDEYTLEKGGQREGLLVFEVPEEVSRAALVFQELYADGESASQYTEGSSYYVWMDL